MKNTHNYKYIERHKKGDNMERYPDEMIHGICQEMYNICWNPNVIAKGFMQCKLKNPAKRRYVPSVSLFIKILVWGWQNPYLGL